MENHHPASNAIGGSTVAISDLSSPLAATIARRLAARAGRLLLASDERSDQSLAMAEVERVRLLSGQYEPTTHFELDTSVEAGAAAFVGRWEEAGPVDAAIHVTALSAGSGEEALAPVRAMLRLGAAALAHGRGGRLVIVLDLGSCTASRLSSRARARLEQAFQNAIRAEAATYFKVGVVVNGVVVRLADGEVGHALAFGRNDGASNTDGALAETWSAAAGVAELLVGASAFGITGQVFRVGGPPSPPSSPQVQVRPRQRAL